MKEALNVGLCGVSEDLRQALERLLHWYLYVFDNAVERVVFESTGVTLYAEAKALAVKNLDGLQIVKFGHALDLSELDVVAILESVALVFMHCHVSVLVLLNS